MRIDDGCSIGNHAMPDEVDELLRSRMKILGLDIDAISRDYHEVFDKSGKTARALRIRFVDASERGHREVVTQRSFARSVLECALSLAGRRREVSE